MNYSFERISTAEACDTLLAMVQKEKRTSFVHVQKPIEKKHVQISSEFFPPCHLYMKNRRPEKAMYKIKVYCKPFNQQFYALDTNHS